jgi:hypothetical protein
MQWWWLVIRCDGGAKRWIPMARMERGAGGDREDTRRNTFKFGAAPSRLYDNLWVNTSIHLLVT